MAKQGRVEARADGASAELIFEAGAIAGGVTAPASPRIYQTWPSAGLSTL
jgi:hypothetical protein